MVNYRHTTTDPACVHHRAPRTWLQRRRYERGRGIPCAACEIAGARYRALRAAGYPHAAATVLAWVTV